MSEDDDFLSRWSRRKRDTQEKTDPVVDVAAAPTETSASESMPVEVPDPTALDPNRDDFSVFMHPQVDAALRRVALRKLFASGRFGVPDGLNDYDEDFTRFEPLGALIPRELRWRNAIEEERKAAEAAVDEPHEEAVGAAEEQESEEALVSDAPPDLSPQTAGEQRS